MTAAEQHLWETVQALNRAWAEGRRDDVLPFLHRDRVGSWRTNDDGTTVLEWREDDAHVRIYQSVAAVVTYAYVVRYRPAGGEPRERRGRDAVFLVRENGRWLVIADQLTREK